MKLVVVGGYLEVTKDTIAQYVVEPTKLHTKLSMLLSHLQIESKVLLPDALECQVRFYNELDAHYASCSMRKFCFLNLHCKFVNKSIFEITSIM